MTALRTHFLSQGEIDMSATTAKGADVVNASKSVSDAAVVDLLDNETEVEISVVDKSRTRAGGAFSNTYLTLCNLENGLFKTIDRNNYKLNCLYLALQTGGLSDIELQRFILTLRNRTIHTCDLTNVCNVLETNELTSLKDEYVKSSIEHYPQHPFIDLKKI